MICHTTGVNDPRILFPSQMRYMDYVHRVFNGERPITKRICIDRVILNGIPVIEDDEGSCIRPYLQIFRGATMLFSSASSSDGVVSYF